MTSSRCSRSSTQQDDETFLASQSDKSWALKGEDMVGFRIWLSRNHPSFVVTTLALAQLSLCSISFRRQESRILELISVQYT